MGWNSRVGTRSGVAVLDQSQWYQYTTQNSGLGNDKIRDIAAAPDGSVWFATAGGVFRWHLQQWTSYTTQNSGIPSNNIQAIAVAPSGDVWIGTENAGVAVLHQHQWKRYAMDNSPLPSNVILALYATTDAIWIATCGRSIQQHRLLCRTTGSKRSQQIRAAASGLELAPAG